MQGKTDSVYIAIDLKSFYTSVECVDRGLDQLTTNLVVADQSRSDKTICLAVSTALKLPTSGAKPPPPSLSQRLSWICLTALQTPTCWCGALP